MDTGGTEKEKNFTEMRKSKRIDYLSKIYCTKSINNGESEEYSEPLVLTLLNISSGGLGIISDKLFERGSILVLRMELEGIGYDKVTTQVIWSIKKDSVYRHGLMIINISGKLYSHLSRLDNSITTTV